MFVCCMVSLVLMSRVLLVVWWCLWLVGCLLSCGVVCCALVDVVCRVLLVVVCCPVLLLVVVLCFVGVVVLSSLNVVWYAVCFVVGGRC